MTFQGIRRGILKLTENDPHLGLLIQEEKDVIETFTRFLKERTEALSYLSKWGVHEHPDLMDITVKWQTINTEFQKYLALFLDAYSEYRDKLKEIKKHSDLVNEAVSKHKNAHDKLQKAINSGKPLGNMENQVAQLEYDVNVKRAECESIKRQLLRDALIRQSQGWALLAKQMEVLSVFQTHLANQIPQGTLAPGQELPIYIGATTTQQILNDFITASSRVETSRKGINQSQLQETNRTSEIDMQHAQFYSEQQVEMDTNSQRNSLYKNNPYQQAPFRK